MREMDLVIAVDSAALALSGMTKTPSISFFGPSLASVYKPMGDHHGPGRDHAPMVRNLRPAVRFSDPAKQAPALKMPLQISF